jgi:hypothetical protein
MNPIRRIRRFTATAAALIDRAPAACRKPTTAAA